jgi:outer membrane protein OmpA-like peptidoglycan-associated protein
LQNELRELHDDPRIAPYAQDDLHRADVAVALLSADNPRTDPVIYEHRVYVSDRLIRTAEAQGMARFAEARAVQLGVERDRLLVDAKNRDLHEARIETDNALAVADAERRRADIARSDAQDTRAEVDALRADLRDLQAQQTQRGLMVTLGDFLFETGRAELKPGAARTLDGLARALRHDPNATVEIDGHTDASGDRGYNPDLSLRRAQAVQSYLTSRGIDPQRITTRGFGPDYPVASNNTETGRQQNRRVEVIVQTRVASR